MGIGALLLFLGCFMVVLSWADYSYVSPVVSHRLRRGPAGGPFPPWREGGAPALGWNIDHLRGCGLGGPHRAEYHEARMTIRTAVFLAITVLANTGGEIAVTRAMKDIGEVKNFELAALFAVLGRAFRSRLDVAGNWAISGGLFLSSHLAVLGGCQLCDSRYRAQLRSRRARREAPAGGTAVAGPLGRDRAGLRRSGARVRGLV